VWQHVWGKVGYLMTALLEIFRRMWQWKNFENRTVFDEVMCRLRWLTFFGPPCIHNWPPYQTVEDMRRRPCCGYIHGYYAGTPANYWLALYLYATSLTLWLLPVSILTESLKDTVKDPKYSYSFTFACFILRRNFKHTVKVNLYVVMTFTSSTKRTLSALITSCL